MLWASILGLVAAALFPTKAPAQTAAELDRVVYHTCYDGDTCMVSLPGVHPFFGDHILIRLAGIDTPEMKGRCDREKLLAKEARDFLRGVLGQAETIRLVKATRDKYFRIDATILADGADTSKLMIDKGYAVPYDGGTKTGDWCVPPEEMPSKDAHELEAPSDLPNQSSFPIPLQ